MSNQVKKIRKRKERVYYTPPPNSAFIPERPLMGEEGNRKWDEALKEYIQQFK